MEHNHFLAGNSPGLPSCHDKIRGHSKGVYVWRTEGRGMVWACQPVLSKFGDTLVICMCVRAGADTGFRKAGGGGGGSG